MITQPAIKFCHWCHGYPLVFLGRLGGKRWYRCPFCGLEQWR